MAGAILSLDLLVAQLDRPGSAVDLTPALRQCAVLLGAKAKECFAAGTDPAGIPWKPLKRHRPNSKGSDKPLRDKGLLMASIGGGAARGHVEQLTPTMLVYGSNLHYAAIHQHGGKIKKSERRRARPWVFKVGNATIFTKRIRAHTVTIPARPFLGLTPAILQDLGRILGDFTLQRLGMIPPEATNAPDSYARR